MNAGVRLACAGVLAVTLAACGYHPLYATRDNGTNVATELAAISIPAPQSRLEQLLRNELMSSLQASDGGGTYTLVIAPKASTSSVVANPTPSMYRYSYALTVGYKLLRASDRSVLTAGTSKAFVSYDRFKQPVAAMSTAADAERRAVKDAGDDIRMRLSAYFAGQQSGQ